MGNFVSTLFGGCFGQRKDKQERREAAQESSNPLLNSPAQPQAPVRSEGAGSYQPPVESTAAASKPKADGAPPTPPQEVEPQMQPDAQALADAVAAVDVEPVAAELAAAPVSAPAPSPAAAAVAPTAAATAAAAAAPATTAVAAAPAPAPPASPEPRQPGSTTTEQPAASTSTPATGKSKKKRSRGKKKKWPHGSSHVIGLDTITGRSLKRREMLCQKHVSTALLPDHRQVSTRETREQPSIRLSWPRMQGMLPFITAAACAAEARLSEGAATLGSDICNERPCV
eukprot:CAMPEP_0117683960 /NCGR_PEP_ID=MMETSP0804-20121206/20770_1 /TAXON_ID=1074897 /ORGANISM="Tetraselmis astigmatica, Strain CCMP880" /LENGTH=284 /DNA_ID=CAMNT_0005494771 /DNA_START=112 /DNA_END=964 /DNA_ORIENTATION=-